MSTCFRGIDRWRLRGGDLVQRLPEVARQSRSKKGGCRQSMLQQEIGKTYIVYNQMQPVYADAGGVVTVAILKGLKAA